MDPYVAAHLRELEDLHRQVFEMVAPLDDDAINRPVPGLTNTVGIVLRHMAGSERYWIGEVVGGRAAHRHRDAEFGHERLRKTALMQELGGVDTLSREVLGRLTRDDLLQEVDIIIKKRSNVNLQLSPTGARLTRKVCIIENNPQTLSAIGSAFLSAGFMVNPAQNGTEGIERIANTVPDVALVKLGLLDIPGDMVILKLKYMAKTQDVKYILYTDKRAEAATIAKKISEKAGVDRFIEYIDPGDLVAAAGEILKR